MRPVLRLVLLLAVAVTGLSAAGLLVVLSGASAVGAMPALTPTSSVTPTATATATPVFTATLLIQPHQPAVTLGETLTVTVDIDVSEGCEYYIFELTLAQTEDQQPIFTHIDPPSGMITGAITLPSVWTFQATAPGVATFDARTFGERYCNDNAWIWHYLSGESGAVVVGQTIYRSWLPAVNGPE